MKHGTLVPIKSWCADIEDQAMVQAQNLAAHPVVFSHVALMPDCHVGYGMPIGGVIACRNAVIPNAVGVDIGCGMCAVKTSLPASALGDMPRIRKLLDAVKQRVPAGEGHSHHKEQCWDGFERFLDETVGRRGIDVLPWADAKSWSLHKANLGTLGGGNHFIELQCDGDNNLWLMLHSGSRNLGHRIASFYHSQAQRINETAGDVIPCRDLAFLKTDDESGQSYVRDMKFALEYARENRRRMMHVMKTVVADFLPLVEFITEINIHHNYAALENHLGNEVWVHRKGATSARDGEQGIIPGSMGTASYIVRGRGNPESFMSCSHGAGRKMGRKEACRRLDPERCDKAMEGIVFDRWHRCKDRKGEKIWELSEAPQAYKNIETVIEAQLDLIIPEVVLQPLGVVKG